MQRSVINFRGPTIKSCQFVREGVCQYCEWVVIASPIWAAQMHGGSDMGSRC